MAPKQSKNEVETENLNQLAADNSLKDPKTDRLGYAPFAKHLADSICQMTAPEGFVIAVYGAWGSGKSTLLNFLVHYLQQQPENSQALVVPFNPWLFAGDEDLTKRFFDQLQSAVGTLKYVPKGWKDRIADLANVVSEIPLPYAQAGKAVANLFDDKEKDTSDLKEEVEASMEQEQTRIVVTIDDIDRLDTEEIKKLFRILKAIPNFTNLIYVLGFDKEIVIKALADVEGISGEVYLERIVQVDFELPIPDKTLLRRLLFEKLDAVLADTPKQLFERAHWGNVYFKGIDPFITNIRDLVRLTNQLSVTYPAVKGEVNVVDFIAIECLREFCPTIYDIIRKNPNFFAGDADNKDFSGNALDSLQDFHNEWLAEVQEQNREPVKRLLSCLFPRLQVVWGNTEGAARQNLTSCRQKAVSSLEIFPIYFRMALPEGELSDTEIQASLALAQDAQLFGENLVELANQKRPDGTTKVRAFLERLEDYSEKEIPASCISSIVQALFDVGDRLLPPEDEPCSMFDFGNDIKIRRIIWQLLRRLDEPVRFEVLTEAMLTGNAASTIADAVAVLAQQHGKLGVSLPLPEAERLVNAERLKELEDIASNKIRDAARQNTLLQAPKLPENLYYWRSWAGEDEVTEWVQQVIADDSGLADFLEKFLEKTVDNSESDVVEKIEAYLDLPEMVDRVRSLAENSELTEAQKTATGQFLQEYDTRQSGQEPSTHEVE